MSKRLTTDVLDDLRVLAAKQEHGSFAEDTIAEAMMLIASLRSRNAGLLLVATGQLRHVYAGLCPDAATSPDVRDPDCAACAAIDGRT